jgi:hypothetical protein
MMNRSTSPFFFGSIYISSPDEIEEVKWMDCKEAEKYLTFPNGKADLIRKQGFSALCF